MILLKSIGRPIARLRDHVAAGLVRCGLSANLLTATGLVLSLVAGLLFALDHFRWAAAALLVACVLDLLDGAVARAGTSSSRFGAFFDSSLDRYSDSAVFVGLLVHYLLNEQVLPVCLAASALVGSLLVSYTRARAECFLESCNVGLVTRGERLGAILLAAVFGNLLMALWLLATMTHWTVLVRVHYTWRQLTDRPVPSRDSFKGQLYRLFFWDWDRGSLPYDVAMVLWVLAIVLVRL